MARTCSRSPTATCKSRRRFHCLTTRCAWMATFKCNARDRRRRLNSSSDIICSRNINISTWRLKIMKKNFSPTSNPIRLVYPTAPMQACRSTAAAWSWTGLGRPIWIHNINNSKGFIILKIVIYVNYLRWDFYLYLIYFNRQSIFSISNGRKSTIFNTTFAAKQNTNE